MNETLILQLFRTAFILERFLKLQQTIDTNHLLSVDTTDIPQNILCDVKRRYAESLRQLKDHGIDGEAYLKSPAGQIEYTTYCLDREHIEKLHDRCRQCVKFMIKHDKDGSSIDQDCEVYKDPPMNCKQFEDTGIDFFDRIATCIDRCSKCDYYKTINDVIVHEICSIGCNEIKPVCLSFKNTHRHTL